MGRRKKSESTEPKVAVAEATSENVAKEDTQSDRQAELERQIEKLNRALQAKAEEASALKTLSKTSVGGESVVIENTGMCTLMIDIDPSRDSVALANKGPGSRMAVPVHVVENIRRTQKWFDLGYVRVVGENDDNPNIIDDVEEWFAETTEPTAKSRVNAITSEGTLHKLWNHLEEPDRRDNITGVQLQVKRHITKRVDKLFGYDLVEDNFGRD